MTPGNNGSGSNFRHVMRAIASQPNDRYPTANALVHDPEQIGKYNGVVTDGLE